MDTTVYRDTSGVQLPDNLLELDPGDQPVKIYVKRVGNDAAFALHPDAPDHKWFTGGIEWFPTAYSDNALFIKFEFLADISYLDCDPPLLYGPVVVEGDPAGQPAQDCGVPPLPAGRTKPVIYSFTVHFSDQTWHDPKIVVTPLPGEAEQGSPDRPRRRRRDGRRGD